ncbi:MAG: ABC transporter ATP-binding protein [Chitinivibrionales bacterium]|nr:ABC transporter ATP-binding protein [Chitinivibrionales bacterium]
MNLLTKLPPQISQKLSGKGPVRYALRGDLAADRSFKERYLIVTERAVIVAEESGETIEYNLSDCSEIRLDELVGGGRLSAIVKGEVRQLVSYSNHYVPQFSVLARAVNALIAGKSFELPEENFVSFCARCGAPLPERDSTCPRCVPRLKIFARIFALTKPYKGRVAVLMIVTALGVSFQVVQPWLTRLLVDNVVGGRHPNQLLPLIGAMMAGATLFLLMRMVNVYLAGWISGRIVTDLRAQLHSVLQYLKINFFNRREPGEFTSRVMYDTNELYQFLVDGLPFLLINSLMFMVIGVILVLSDWRLAIFVFLPVPFLVLGSNLFWQKLIPLFHQQGSAVGHMHNTIKESQEGIRVVKAFAQQERRIRQFSTVNRRIFSTTLNIQRTWGAFNEVMFWVMNMGVALVWFFAVKRMVLGDKHLTLGVLFAYIGYIWLFYGPLQWFSVVINWMTHAFAGAERIFEIIDSSTEAFNDPRAISLPKVAGSIEFTDVRFSYERGKEVIKGATFAIKAGETIGLVGKSGAGKSTIINLINRFFEVDSGEILIDGVPIKKIKLEQLRKSIGIVMQDPFLFNATIAENIAFGMEHADFSDIVRAAQAAFAHDFIIKKEDGYDTMVGEDGAKLSGGEKQRISIARAILHDPPILILDEATSSVDVNTEKHIQEATAALIKNRTTIAIAHRLSTLRNADRLIVLDEGKVAEIGTHDELMQKPDGIYAQLAQTHNEMSRLRGVVWKE